MKTRIVLLCLLVMAMGCGPNKSPRAAYRDAAYTFGVLVDTMTQVKDQCDADPDNCPLNEDQWKAIITVVVQGQQAMRDWNIALKNDNDYWSPQAVAVNSIVALQSYLEMD